MEQKVSKDESNHEWSIRITENLNVRNGDHFQKVIKLKSAIYKITADK